MANVIVNHKHNYGFPFAEQTPQPQIELFGYALTRGKYGKYLQSKILHSQGACLEDFKFLSPLEHVLNFSKWAWPTELIFESRGYLNRPLIRVLEVLCEHDDVGIAGAGGLGKSKGAAAFINVDWMAAPDVTSTFLASLTFEGLENRIWGHVSNLYKSCLYKVGTYLDYKRCIIQEVVNPDDEKKRDRDYINSIKALAFPVGSEGRKSVDTTRGRHNKRVRMFVDEQAEMEMYVNKVRANLLTNLDVIFCGIANPLPGENPHRELCQPDHPKKWDSITVDTEKWKTRTGVAIMIHGEKDNPNLQAPEGEPPPFPFFPDRDSLRRILESEHGNRDSLEYYRNAIGGWPPDTIQTSVISRNAIRSANVAYEPVWTGERTYLATLDCGQTAGGDRNILTFGFLGTTRDIGRKALMFQGQKGYSVSVHESFEDSLAKQVVDDLDQIGVLPENFALDISGDGGKIMSAIIRYWSNKQKEEGKEVTAHKIVGISSSGKPTDRIVSSKDNRKSDEVYDRLVTEYCFSLYHAICGRYIFGLDIDQMDDELVSEVCSRQYTKKGGKMSVETKAEMKKRMGKSPDKSDSFTYFCELGRRRGMNFYVESDAPQAPEHYFHFKRRERIEKREKTFSYAGTSRDPDGF